MALSQHSSSTSSRKLTAQEAADIKKRLAQGELQSRIASAYDVNQGRISEINTGKLFPEVGPTS